jgi:hypothetical protein
VELEIEIAYEVSMADKISIGGPHSMKDSGQSLTYRPVVLEIEMTYEVSIGELHGVKESGSEPNIPSFGA